MRFLPFIFTCLFGLSAGKALAQAPYDCGFVFKNHKRVQKYFGPELQVIPYRSGDTIAFIGAANGYRAAMLATLVDSLHFYLQDIDTFCLNPGNVALTWAYYQQMQPEMSHSSYQLQVGDEHWSHLPAGKMDKVVITATFHHFSDTQGMLRDLRQLLKPEGRLYVIENVVDHPGESRKQLCPHLLYTIADLTALFEAHGFRVESRQDLHMKYTQCFELSRAENPAPDLQGKQ